MQENFIHFLSKENCLLAINGKEIGLIDNKNNLELDIITKTDRIFVSYNTISNKKNMIPYTFQLNTAEPLNTDNEYIKVVPFPNNNYDVIMSPFYYYQIDNSQVLLNKQIGNYFISIVSDNSSKITIYSGASIVFTLNTIKLKSATVSQKKDILTIKGIVDEETYYLLILDSSNFTIIHNDISHSIEECDTDIQTLKNLKDIAHHSIVCKIDFESKTSQNYHVYENNFSAEPHSALLIPKLFLECINTNDEEIAKKYLIDKYQSTPLSQFRNYFGDIKNIYLNRHLILQDKLNYTVFTNSYKNYNFIMENNKIKDIEEVFWL